MSHSKACINNNVNDVIEQSKARNVKMETTEKAAQTKKHPCEVCSKKDCETRNIAIQRGLDVNCGQQLKEALQQQASSGSDPETNKAFN